jgi:hypothetical protein
MRDSNKYLSAEEYDELKEFVERSNFDELFERIDENGKWIPLTSEI